MKITQTNIQLIAVLSLACLHCGDDRPSEGATDTGSGNTSSPDGAESDGTADGSEPDASEDALEGEVAELECFDFWTDEIAAIPGAFDETSDMWWRPHDDEPVCPATAVLPGSSGQVPFVAFAFCNREDRELTYNFEMSAQEGPDGEGPVDDPFLILYEGNGIPVDPRQCLAINDDIEFAMDTADSEILNVTVPVGGAITVVGTVYQFDPDDGTGAGGYLLVVEPVDM
jgi:hypothetical protein